jgi:hypothetical protein
MTPSRLVPCARITARSISFLIIGAQPVEIMLPLRRDAADSVSTALDGTQNTLVRKSCGISALIRQLS